MTGLTNTQRGANARRAEDLRKRRRFLDSFTRWTIAVGGVGIIGAVVLILFYLIWVVFPLFLAPDAELRALDQGETLVPGETLYLGVEEQLEVATRITGDGRITFFHVDGLDTVYERFLGPSEDVRLVEAVESDADPQLLALLSEDGRVTTVRKVFETDFSDGIENRRIEPSVEFADDASWRPLTDGQAVRGLAFSSSDNAMVIAALGENRIFVEYGTISQNFITGASTLDSRLIQTAIEPGATTIAVSGNQRWVYVGDENGQVHRFELPGLEKTGVTQASDRPITAMRMLLGGISVLAGDASGQMVQLFPVRDAEGAFQLTRIREFESQGAAITRIQTEYRRKGFLALDSDNQLGVYHSTAGQRVLLETLPPTVPEAVAIGPRANGILTIGEDGNAYFLDIENKHPEISLASLWGKVWYENYEEPAHIWQSSSASNDFEPKFSLTPLAFGTLKAALYAMLFAVPLALAGAAFTAYFMAPGLRQVVKPTIEIMAALPTVILGFLAGLWFAPFLEENLAAMFAIFLVVPVGLFVFSWFGSQNTFLKARIPEGWEPALLIPVMIALVWLSMELAQPLQHLLFGGDMRTWLSEDLGVSYDQRNALVVGVAMGFAVIPTIFSIAEDAVFGVPKSLSDGSLALGATRWQTMVRVILPTASPGIFSGLMIGLGRAVGETMIVLMATGNTPIMDWNLFEGMRTLAANIAVEMPESEVNSSHYRILFLAALTLFVFTFIVNTVAEIIRQRLRDKYGSL